MKIRNPKHVARTVLAWIFCVLMSACESLELAPPVHGSPTATINTTDVARIKTAIVKGMTKRGFSLESDSGNLVVVSRPLSKLQVFLLTETIASSADRQIETFKVVQEDQVVHLVVWTLKQMKLPGGGFNNDPLIDKAEFDELQDFLKNLKLEIEHG